MNSENLPYEIIKIAGNETREFEVKSKRANPIGKSISRIIGGLVVIGFTSIFIIGFFGRLLIGDEAQIRVNGAMQTVSMQNLTPALFPALIIGLFMIVGLSILIGGIVSLFKSGGWFIATPTRLIEYRKGETKSIDWEQFNGVISVRKDSILMQLRSGTTTKKGKFVPDIVYISGVPNIYEIENICRKRIKENDPTPAKNKF